VSARRLDRAYQDALVHHLRHGLDLRAAREMLLLLIAAAARPD
jgi:hypothetical protein